MTSRSTPPHPVLAPQPGAEYDERRGDTTRRPGGIAYETGELHRLLVESVQDYAIFALDVDGYILSWNAGAQRFKGYDALEAIGQHFSIFYPPDAVATGFPQYELKVAAEVGRFEDEGWRIRKDGSRFWANVLITALRDDDGQLLGFAKVTRDLTERRAAHLRELEDARRLASEETARRTAEDRAQELHDLATRLSEQARELELRRVEAEHANKAKSAFLAAMSHELRTPLNAIGGYAELLQIGVSGPVTKVQVEQLERIRRSQQHLLRVINDILNFSRVEAAQLTYDIADVAVQEVTEAVEQMIAPQTGRKGLHFEIDPIDPALRVRADQAKLQQVLLNLLSNALKFTAPGGRIRLTWARDGTDILGSVSDTGVGIPRDKLDAVFEPFVQVGRSLTSDHEGTGLGLAISRDLARAMQGDITVTSDVEAGSTFTVRLPAANR